MSKARILVVEDERIIAMGIERRLTRLGYIVVDLASTGPDAVQKATQHRPDLVLMDINLGGEMDGIDAAKQMGRKLDVPVVYLTAFSDDVTLQRAKLTGPFGYVLKPYEDKDLQTAIEIGLYKHQLELRLRENEQWLAATLGSIGDGVIATDEQGKVRLVNTLAEQLTGWTQAEALGKDIREVFQIIGEKTRESVLNPIFEAIETVGPATLDPDTILIDAFGNERPIDDSAAPIRNASGNLSGAVLVFRDVTERRRLEEHLRQSQKLEAIGRLAGGIAHDFNNLMTIINGFSEIMITENQLPPEYQEFVQGIHRAGHRAATLTQQITAFSRQQILVPCILNLNDIVQEMGMMVKRLIGANIDFVIETSPDLGSVMADATQISQVFLNLVTNARDAMPNGGKLTVTTSNVDFSEPTTVRSSELESIQYVTLSISDTGSGMTDEVLAHIFEPFFTTKAQGHGTGLGLATVYGIVKQSGGHIETTSEVGVGTTFRIYLPMVSEIASAPVDQIQAAEVKGNETILVVEDEDTVRRMVKLVLEQQGYHVLEASNGNEGLAVAERHSGPIHLLITDLVMPKLSGRELAARLTMRMPDLPILFMSGYAEDIVNHPDQAPAITNFLQKPFNLAAMTRIVRAILDGDQSAPHEQNDQTPPPKISPN